MNELFSWLVRQRGLALVMMASLAALGLIAWNRVPIDAFPDASNQQVMILSEAGGLGPLDVEQQITVPVESVLGGLPGLVRVRSLSKTGLSQVVVVFEDRIDTYFARQLVFERLQLAREQLPEGIEPELGPISTGLGEIYQYNLVGPDHSLSELRTLQDWVVAPRLRAIPGVNEVNSFGGQVRQLQVEVDPARLLAYQLTLPEIVEALAANNANAGGGFIVKHWEQENIRSVGLFGGLQDLRDIVLRAEDGTPVRLGDLATVREGHVTRQGAVSRDGEGEVAAGMVIMLKGENSKQVVERVKAALPAIQRSLPEGVRLDPFYDRTELVSAVIRTVTQALGIGSALVVLVLFLLIGRLRAALVAAVSLPLTALFTGLAMDGLDLTANLMTLGGLAIAIGMVVDASIVITENTVRHLGRPGVPPQQAVVHAAREVARPIFFSVSIILLVFLPLFTLEGMEGKMFKPLALTVMIAMAGSLLVALFGLPPLLASLFPRGTQPSEARLLGWLKARYLEQLDNALAHRKLTLIGYGLAGLLALGTAPLLGSEFLPELDEGAIAINVVRLPNAALVGSVATSTHLERILLEFSEVRSVVSKTGRAEISEDPMGPEQTDLLIMLHPAAGWTSGRSKAELVTAMQAKLDAVPGIRLAFSQPIALRVNELISGVKSDLAVKVFGPDLEVLKAHADRVADALRGVPGAQDISVEQVAGFSQLEIIPDRRAMARHQLNMADINQLVETAVGGTVATELVDGQRRFGVQVRFPERARNSVEAITRLLVPTPAGARIPLGQLAKIRRFEGPAQISRENAMRRVVVEANVRGRDLGGFVAEAQQRIEAIEGLPEGSWIEYGGTFASQQRATRRLAVAVPVALLLIALMLTSALGSARSAALVLAVLPFAALGGLVSMWLLGERFNVPASIGFIALFGTAVQNGTVLVTFFDQLRQQGRSVRQAVREGCTLRLRALLMTAATTVLALAPLVLASGPGAELQRPLAVVVMGGLVSATVLTLFVLPVLYDGVMGRREKAQAKG